MTTIRLALGLAVLALATQAHASLVGTDGEATYQVSASGALSTLSSPAGGATAEPLLIALATSKAGVVYGLDVGGWPDLAAELVSFDASGAVASTAQLTYQGTPVLVAEALAFAPSGKLWVSFGAGADYQWYESGHVGQVDPTTGVINPATVLTLAGYHNADADSLEFVGGALFMTDNLAGQWSNLYQVNTTTGAVTLVGRVEGAAGTYQVTDLAWDGSTLYAETYSDDGTGRLISIDRRTGAATPVGSPRALLYGLTAIEDACHGKACK